MNFYKRHLGDLAKSCGDLSQGQMGAYDLLTDWHYANEEPLPLDKGRLYRIGRAVSKTERANVDQVLEQFFDWTADGYTQKRALEEMAKAHAQAEANRQVAAEREARKRQRTEHESLHERGNESFNENATSPTTNRQPSHKPLATSQEAFTPNQLASAESLEGKTTAERACQLMAEAGCSKSNPSHPALRTALAEGVSPETLGHTAREAITAGKSNPFAWAIATARSRLAEGTGHAVAPIRPSAAASSPAIVGDEAKAREREALRLMVEQFPEMREALTEQQRQEIDDAA